MDARNSSDVNPLKLAVFRVGNSGSSFVVSILSSAFFPVL
jgi:hypothetical protein